MFYNYQICRNELKHLSEKEFGTLRTFFKAHKNRLPRTGVRIKNFQYKQHKTNIIYRIFT